MKKQLANDVEVMVSDGIVSIKQSGTTIVLVEKEIQDILALIKEEDAMFNKQMAELEIA